MSKWEIDPDHTVAAFTIRHMMIAFVHGQFNKITGTINFDSSNISNASTSLVIDTSSIITGIQKRDAHLKSMDFFHIEKYPKINYKSTSCEMTGFNSCRIIRTLTIQNTTKPVEMEMTFSGPVKKRFGETGMGSSAKTVINRNDFGITWNTPLENGGLMVG